MGNCQAIDNSSIAIQHSSGRVEKLYSSVPASQIIKLNPSHYVALLLTTTTTAVATTGGPLRITRIKLLRPTDTLLLGHTYRLISAQGTHFFFPSFLFLHLWFFFCLWLVLCLFRVYS